MSSNADRIYREMLEADRRICGKVTQRAPYVLVTELWHLFECRHPRAALVFQVLGMVAYVVAMSGLWYLAWCLLPQ